MPPPLRGSGKKGTGGSATLSTGVSTQSEEFPEYSRGIRLRVTVYPPLVTLNAAKDLATAAKMTRSGHHKPPASHPVQKGSRHDKKHEPASAR